MVSLEQIAHFQQILRIDAEFGDLLAGFDFALAK